MRFFFKTDFKLELCTPKFFEDLSPNPSTTWPWSTSRAIQATYLRQLRKNWEQKEDSNQEMPSEKTSKKRFFCLIVHKKTGSWNNFPLKLWRNICPGPHRFLVFCLKGLSPEKFPTVPGSVGLIGFDGAAFPWCRKRTRGSSFLFKVPTKLDTFKKRRWVLFLCFFFKLINLFTKNLELVIFKVYYTHVCVI